jgi:CubicO group peptidase (beta-lactamase class C family)
MTARHFRSSFFVYSSLALLAGIVWFLVEFAPLAAAYKAKLLCSGVFVSKRDPQSILSQDLDGEGLGFLRIVDAELDRSNQRVTASVLGRAQRTAVFRENLGCTLAIDASEQELKTQAANVPWPVNSRPAGDDPFPPEALAAEQLPPEINGEQLARVMEEAFAEPDPDHLRQTRALLLVYKDQLIAERYADGFDKETPLLGWSMTKSVLNAVIGTLVQQGRLDLQRPLAVPEWGESEDPRARITLDQLLRMSSGLAFFENYVFPFTGTIYMLLGTADAGKYAAEQPLEAEPGSHWYYSSGTSNLISRHLRQVLGEAYLAYPRSALFDRIGMRGAVMEPDASGTFTASSFMYATARDWARFGLLYLHDGVWNGERILPEGWVKYSVTPSSAAPEREYGAHFWLKLPEKIGGTVGGNARLPEDAFFALGHEGQSLTIVPSRQLVVVRLGITRRPGAWDQAAFMAGVLEAIRAESAASAR